MNNNKKSIDIKKWGSDILKELKEIDYFLYLIVVFTFVCGSLSLAATPLFLKDHPEWTFIQAFTVGYIWAFIIAFLINLVIPVGGAFIEYCIGKLIKDRENTQN